MGQVAGVASESVAAGGTNGFLGWSPEPDRTPYTIGNGRDGSAPAVYADLTAYAVGKSVTYLGLTYVARVAVPGANTTKPDVLSSFVNVENHRGGSEIQSPTVASVQFYR